MTYHLKQKIGKIQSFAKYNVNSYDASVSLNTNRDLGSNKCSYIKGRNSFSCTNVVRRSSLNCNNGVGSNSATGRNSFSFNSAAGRNSVTTDYEEFYRVTLEGRESDDNIPIYEDVDINASRHKYTRHSEDQHRETHRSALSQAQTLPIRNTGDISFKKRKRRSVHVVQQVRYSYTLLLRTHI